jgi:nucleoid-associated protein YgaU
MNSEIFTVGSVPDTYMNTNSRLRDLRVVTYDDEQVLEFPSEPVVAPGADEIIYTVQAGEEGRLDLIASRVYGDPSLWWFIAGANNIFNPFSLKEMYAGMPIRIPPSSRVKVA